MIAENLAPLAVDKRFLYRPKWNKKGDIRFLSIYTFYSESHIEGISYFKTIKQEIQSSVLDSFAGDIIIALKSTFLNLKGLCVTNAPRGHSKTPLHFATELAKATARVGGLDYVSLFQDRKLKGTSHPRNYYTRNKISLSVSELPNRGLILIDDLVTSGTTMTACLANLKDRFVVPVALIYGNHRGDNDDWLDLPFGFLDSLESASLFTPIVEGNENSSFFYDSPISDKGSDFAKLSIIGRDDFNGMP